MRMLERRLERLFGEYFVGTETSRWYRNQSGLVRESDLSPESVRYFLDGYRFSSAVHFLAGRLIPNLVLGYGILSYYQTREFPQIALAGEVIRFVVTGFDRMQRKPANVRLEHFLTPVDETDTWSSGEGTRWEDEGEEWKRERT